MIGSAEGFGGALGDSRRQRGLPSLFSSELLIFWLRDAR
jgi:hypothetical protein